jgi:hypothetical protein
MIQLFGYGCCLLQGKGDSGGLNLFIQKGQDV